MREQGIVSLKDWMHGPDGRSYLQYSGFVEIAEVEKMIGFKSNDRESNWVARVFPCQTPTANERSVNILGCQVRGVTLGIQPDACNQSCYRVKSI